MKRFLACAAGALSILAVAQEPAFAQTATKEDVVVAAHCYALVRNLSRSGGSDFQPSEEMRSWRDVMNAVAKAAGKSSTLNLILTQEEHQVGAMAGDKAAAYKQDCEGKLQRDSDGKFALIPKS